MANLLTPFIQKVQKEAPKLISSLRKTLNTPVQKNSLLDKVGKATTSVQNTIKKTPVLGGLYDVFNETNRENLANANQVISGIQQKNPIKAGVGVAKTAFGLIPEVAGYNLLNKTSEKFQAATGQRNTPEQRKMADTANLVGGFMISSVGSRALAEGGAFDKAVKLLSGGAAKDKSFIENLGRIGTKISNKKNLGKDGEYLATLGENLFGKDAANLTNKQLYNAIDLATQTAAGKRTTEALVGLNVKNVRQPETTGNLPKVPGELPTNAASELNPSMRSTEGPLATLGRIEPKASQLLKSGEDQAKSLPNTISQGVKSVISKFEDKANSIYTKTLDRFNPISQLGKKAGEDQAVRNSLTGYYGTGSIAKYHTDFELAPILQKSDVKDFEKYLVAQRDIELTGQGKLGSNRGAPEKILGDLQKKYGDLSKLESQAQEYYQFKKNLIDKYLIQTGVMNADDAAAMFAKNQKHTPFQRVMDDVDSYLGVPGKQAGSVSSNNVIKGYKGSIRDIKNPIESEIANVYKIVGLGQRQKVAKTIVGLRDKLPEGVIKEIEKPGNTPHIALLENGKTKYYEVPQEVADAAKGMTEDGMNMITRIAAIPAKLLRATATGVNPEFAVPNVARDLQSAFINAGVNPLNWVKGMAHMIKQDDVYKEFLKSGGMTSRVSLDEPFLKETAAALAEPNRVKKALTIKSPKDFYNLLQKMGSYSEQPTRIATFEQKLSEGLKAGLSHEEAAIQAANQAQEATVNFARRGQDTQSLNALYAFINARAQGVDKLVRSIKNDPKGTGARIAFMTLGPAVAAYAWNSKFPSYFDERVVSKSDRENNFIVMISDKPVPELGGAQFVKIPKGDVGKLANPIEEFMKIVTGKGGDAASALGQALLAFSPVSNKGELLPTAGRMIAEPAANYNFFTGQPIVPDYKKNYPAEAQSNTNTPGIYKALADKSPVKFSPAKAQNIVEGLGTGFAKIGASAIEPLVPDKYKAAPAKGQDVNRIPIVRRFLSGEKKTPEEQKATDLSRVKGLSFDMADISIGKNRGDISPQKADELLSAKAKEQRDLLDKMGGYAVDNGRIYYTDGDKGRYVQLERADVNRGTIKSKGVETPLPKGIKEKFNAEATKTANEFIPKLVKSDMWKKASSSERSDMMKQLVKEIKDEVFAKTVSQ